MQDQLQARLTQLDQAIAQCQQDLQGALAAQAQYTAERDRITADIQAVTALSADVTAPNLADLQASRLQNATALEQNQQQITQLQTQLDLFTTEQALIGSTLAQADVARANPVTDFSNVTFALSDANGTAHQLQITDQTGQPNGTATFNGVWDGQSVTGTLAYDATGNIHMTFSADNGTYDTMIAGNPGAFQIAGNFTVGDTLVPVTGSQIA